MGTGANFIRAMLQIKWSVNGPLTLKVVSEVLFMIFVFLCSILHAIVPKFPDIFVHDSYTVRRHFEKFYNHWAAIASDYLLLVYINFQVTITFLGIRLVDTALLSRDSYWLPATITFFFKI